MELFQKTFRERMSDKGIKVESLLAETAFEISQRLNETNKPHAEQAPLLEHQSHIDTAGIFLNA